MVESVSESLPTYSLTGERDKLAVGVVLQVMSVAVLSTKSLYIEGIVGSSETDEIVSLRNRLLTISVVFETEAYVFTSRF